jgi:hypothetical protein
MSKYLVDFWVKGHGAVVIEADTPEAAEHIFERMPGKAIERGIDIMNPWVDGDHRGGR